MLSQSHMLNQGLTSIVDTRVSPYLRADEDLSNFLALHFVEIRFGYWQRHTNLEDTKKVEEKMFDIGHADSEYLPRSYVLKQVYA